MATSNSHHNNFVQVYYEKINYTFISPFIFTHSARIINHDISHNKFTFRNISAAFLKPWVAKACKLPHVKEKDLRTQDFKSEDPFLREHYDFKTKIQKSESDSR